jgi:hypothetical protein
MPTPNSAAKRWFHASAEIFAAVNAGLGRPAIAAPSLGFWFGVTQIGEAFALELRPERSPLDAALVLCEVRLRNRADAEALLHQTLAPILAESNVTFV